MVPLSRVVMPGVSGPSNETVIGSGVIQASKFPARDLPIVVSKRAVFSLMLFEGVVRLAASFMQNGSRLHDAHSHLLYDVDRVVSTPSCNRQFRWNVLLHSQHERGFWIANLRQTHGTCEKS